MPKRRKKLDKHAPKRVKMRASSPAAPTRTVASSRGGGSSGRAVSLAIVGLGLALSAVIAYMIFVARPGFEARPLNVVLVTIDTLRADRLGAYGDRDVPTPHIDGLAERGVVFERAFTSAPVTLPSHASIFTGAYPGNHGVRDNGGRALAPERTTLAEVLSDNGYRTGAFVSAFVLDSRFGLDQGFDLYSDDLETGASGNLGGSEAQRTGDEALDEALAWIGSVEGERFFAWVHLFDPHTPYDPPEPYRSQLDDPYDGEVAYVDSLVGRLLQWLERRALDEDTLVILTADHGESLGEHGEKTHGFFVYDATMRVPLILSAPYEGLSGRRVAALVRTIDIMPTVLELVGLEAPSDADVDGRSLVSLARGRPATSEAPTLAYGEATFPSHYGWSELRSIRDETFLFVDAPRAELYDLSSDPAQRDNVALDRPDDVRAYRERLRAVEPRRDSTSPGNPRRATLAPDVASRLSALGYVGVTSSGGTAREGSRADPKDKIDLFNRIREAATLAELGRLDEARALLEGALDEDPDVLEARNMLAGYLARSGDLEGAVAEYQAALSRDPGYTPAVFGLASAHLDMGRTADALVGLERMLELEPGNPAASLMMARVLTDAGRFEGALARLEAVEPSSPEETSSKLTLMAEARIGLGDLDAAADTIRDVLQRDPLAPTANYQLAVIKEKQGDVEGALAAYDRELRIAPDNYRAHFDLAKLLGQTGRERDMVEHLERSIEANPSFALSHLYLANALLERGELDRAMTLAERGVALDPEPAFAPLGHFILADVYQRLGRGADAAREMEIAQRLHERASGSGSGSGSGSPGR